MAALAPLKTAGVEGTFDIRVRVHGGGPSGQAGAVRHGIARALVEADPELRIPLKREGFLTRDARQVERKKAGLHKARKAPQFSQALTPLLRRYFGTDGVRGVVGAGSDRRARRAARQGRDALVRPRPRLRRSRHARLGPGARGGVRARRRRGGRQRGARGRAADAGGRAARARPRRRHLRLAQPARVQRRQVLRPRREQADRRRRRRRSRRCSTPRARRRHDRPVGVATDSYLEHVVERFGTDLSGLRIAVDCANGAYSDIAPEAFEHLGAEVTAIGDRPERREHQRRLRRHRPRAAPGDGAGRRPRPRRRLRRRRRPHARRGRRRKRGRRRPDPRRSSPSTSASTSSP